ncbi:MAG: TonB-dependent receptor [Burkholderiales bacterium]|nr:TonB-dependent receptor [Burkholderiales bacterium]MDE1925960.1 TonB-dependent receptor [Burkholderiales bacterium]MDE2158131.1 TonB-dependent receptor [Burkholderiales bacterium]MDE2505234.1 TonB-dependent receptor [Burkholderiales bacterium]
MNPFDSDRPRPARSAWAMAAAMLAAAPALAQAAGDDAMPHAQPDAVRLGTITVVGDGAKLGAGQMLKEDAVKGRSTVTKAATEKDLATDTPYQAMALLPGVNTYSYDATGLFGGGLTVRGFNSDQLGFTVNGVPVNDSGNFAVYPQEYVDQENVCTQSVTQGSPDVQSPHSGATGGNITVNTCDPEDKRRLRVAQTLGGLHLTRTFLRVDSGRFADDKAKVFLSYSHTQADKWKGPGQGRKDHLDAGFRYDLGSGSTVLGTLLYNRSVNNNFLTPSLAQLKANGYYWDYSSSFTPGHLTPVNGTAQVEAGPNPAYYKLSVNPFENLVASVSGSFKVNDTTSVKVQPYLWTGYGTGGNQQAVLSETGFLNTSTGKLGAGVDLNGDGDTLDKIIVARGSVTKTSRPGVTAEVDTTLANHQLSFGLWFERADHRQTQPAVPVDANGNPYDIWLRNGQILRPDGTPYEGRDWKTISTAYQAFAADEISILGERGLISLGLRAPHVQRDVTNYANEGFTTTYRLKGDFNEILPQIGLRFALDRTQQVFVNVGKNFRAPPNFAFTGSNVRLNTATGQVELVTATRAETSIMTDLGYRLQTAAFSLSATAFNSDFKDRQANSYNPATDTSTYANAGRVSNHGVEFEIGSASFRGFTAYGSLTLQKSRIRDDMTVTKGQVVPLAGKQFALTPEQMIGASLQYTRGPFYAGLKLKRTGTQYATLMNDEQVPAYTTADLNAGYDFGRVGIMSHTQLRFNIANLGNARYRNPSSGTIVNAVAVGTTSASTVYYYLGAPRLLTLTLSADFD